MEPIDDLLAVAGRVDDITPQQFWRGQAVVDAAVRAEAAGAPFTGRAGRSLTSRRPRRQLGRNLVLTGAVAAAAAVLVTVAVHETGSVRPTAGPTHGVSSSPAGSASSGGKGTTYVTAATVLRAAGKAAGAQPGGWPDAVYWHVSSVYTRAGHTYHRDIWIGHHAGGVLRDPGVGSGVISLGPGPWLFNIGNAGVTWDQLYALPTDPAALTAMLSNNVKGFGPDPNPTGGVSATAELFVVIGDLLRESPASPALREALYNVAAGIPGVRLVGRMKDSLGRTGVGVERNGETLLIDPSNGQLLADMEGNAWSATYVSQGPADTAPAATASQPGQ